jgi:hypothetical protein
VEGVNWLKMLDAVGLVGLVGGNGWFVERIKEKLRGWEEEKIGREKLIEMKRVLAGLSEEERVDLVQTVAAAVRCGWLNGAPRRLRVDPWLGAEVESEVERQEREKNKEQGLFGISQPTGAANYSDSIESNSPRSEATTIQVQSSQTEDYLTLKLAANFLDNSDAIVADSMLSSWP